MRFLILQSEFSRVLLTSGKSILTRANLPILSNVLIKAAGNEVEILSTDLETATKVAVRCKTENGGEITVNGKTLFEFVSQLPEGEVVVEKLGEELVVTTKGYSGRFATMPPEEFPAIPKIGNGYELKIDCQDLVSATARVAFSAAQDEGRPILTGVLCDITKGKMKMVATDGYRLGFEEIGVEGAKTVPNVKIIVPARAFGEVAKIINELGLVDVDKDDSNKKRDLTLLIAAGLNQINFKVAGVEFTSRLIEGEFPNWQKIIPSTFATKVKINKTDFIKLVKIASIFARDSGNIIRLKFEAKDKSGVFSVSAVSSQVGSADTSCEVVTEGKGGEIAFNFRYLLEILLQLPDDEVNFEMNESLNPGRITSGDPKDNFFHIIMPVRLQA